MFVGLRRSRRFRRIGLLRYTPASLDLQLGGGRSHLGLDEPDQLGEGLACGPANMRLQAR